jgi:4-amino-4-deoxy-L-arabinose transferase-like glycosyltransferase
MVYNAQFMRFRAALGFLALSILFTPAGRELFVGDETKYGQVVREMRATGAFFLPTLGGTPFTHKPPLHFWLIDLLTFPLGVYSTWAFVLPSIAAFLALLWLMQRSGGPIAAFVCGSSLMVWGSAQTARMDVSFTFFIALGMLLMERGSLIACGAALGVATLIKGPMAIVIGVVTYLIERWSRRATARPRDLAAAIAVMLAIPAAWFIPAIALGGRDYAREVVMKQTVGRAVAAWVHNAPPWFYVEHLPATLFPWFFLGVIAVIASGVPRVPRSSSEFLGASVPHGQGTPRNREELRGTERSRFKVSWIVAVLVPYSLLSSKLDVYMMAMIPPLALLIGDFVRDADARWTRRGVIANRATIALLLVGCAAGVALAPREFRNALIAATVIALIALAISFRTTLTGTTMVAGIAPIAAALAVMIPMHARINEIGSTRTLIAAIERQHVAPEEVALYSCPYLWSRDLPRDLERVRYVAPDDLRTFPPLVIATARNHAREIAYALDGYRRVDEVEMIGKKFDVYRK